MTSSTPAQASHLAIGGIIGDVVGGIALLVIVVILIFFITRKTSKVSKRNTPEYGATYTGAEGEYIEQPGGRLNHVRSVENPGGRLGKWEGDYPGKVGPMIVEPDTSTFGTSPSNFPTSTSPIAHNIQ